MNEMPAPLWLILAVISLPIGSFLGVLIKRSTRTSLLGRSHCDVCGHVLALRDLIPLVSWLLSGRRCRYCGTPLSWFYPAIEASAFCVVLWAASVATGERLAASVFLGWMLIVLSVIDSRTKRLPNVFTGTLVGLGITTAWLLRENILDHIVGAICGFIGFAGVALVYQLVRKRQGLGLGDAKLLAGLGAFITWRELPDTVFISACLSLSFVLVRALNGSSIGPSERVAFGPFLSVAGWIVWLYGPLLAVA